MALVLTGAQRVVEKTARSTAGARKDFISI